LVNKDSKVNFDNQLEKLEEIIPSADDFDMYGVYPAIDACIALGEITSGTFSPTLKAGIALALVDAKINIGDKVFVDVRGKAAEFLVVKPPFVESKVR
jgi:uncharacterized protein YjaG (DUF416 family)